jgi:UDPglucose 6-dehydrogenase
MCHKSSSGQCQCQRTHKDFIAEEVLRHQPQTVGINRLVMKAGIDNWHASSVRRIMNRLKAKGVRVIVYEPAMEGEHFFHSPLVRDFAAFKANLVVIIANRHAHEWGDMKDKVYTRDLFGGES